MEANKQDEAPKSTGRFGKGNPGKPKGAVNKMAATAKDAIAQAAEALGGTARLVAWVEEDPANERIFWGAIYPKLLPLQVNGAGENGEHLHKVDPIKVLMEQVEGSFLMPKQDG
jgi:hypothetical protein